MDEGMLFTFVDKDKAVSFCWNAERMKDIESVALVSSRIPRVEKWGCYVKSKATSASAEKHVEALFNEKIENHLDLQALSDNKWTRIPELQWKRIETDEGLPAIWPLVSP